MTHKVAIAISGAVSLGSYESGTMYELIHAIKLHNQANPDERIEIDVLSGASAGGMTAAMTAQKLLYEADALDDPVNNCLYEVWINRVDITDLLNPDLGDDPNQSLLSSNCIVNNAHYVFLTRYQQNNTTKNPHEASASTIQLGIALSNLNGVDYELPTLSSSDKGIVKGEFIQTRNQDRFTIAVNQDCDKPEFWQNVMQAGLGSGAFPVAFRPVKKQRDWLCMDYQGRGAKNWEPDFDGQFSYADGGVFNNSPLGMARDLSLRVDDSLLDEDKRYYFYISPHAKTGSTDYSFNCDVSNIVTSFVQVAKSIVSNSGFQDWVQTSHINHELDKLHERAGELLTLICDAKPQELQALETTSHQFCQLLYSKDKADYEKELKRVASLFSSDIPEHITLSDQQKKVWLDAILIMQMNANLGSKDKMRVYTITTDLSELAGSPLFSFFGFLDVRFRIHDYLVGRLKARHAINNIINSAQQGDKQQLPLKVDRLDTSELEKQLDSMAHLRHATMLDIAKSTRKALYQCLKDRSVRVMKILGVGWFARKVIFGCFIKSRIRKFLALQ